MFCYPKGDEGVVSLHVDTEGLFFAGWLVLSLISATLFLSQPPRDLCVLLATSISVPALLVGWLLIVCFAAAEPKEVVRWAIADGDPLLHIAPLTPLEVVPPSDP